MAAGVGGLGDLASGIGLALTVQIGPTVAYFEATAVRLFAIYIGYRIIRLGTDVLVKGIQGGFDFGGKVRSDVELKLTSSSPGLLFVLLGSLLIGWAVLSKPEVKFPPIDVQSERTAPQQHGTFVEPPS